MATALLRAGVAFATGLGVGAVATAASTGHAQTQPQPRRQPPPRVQNAPSRPPRVSNRTMQEQAKAKAAEAAATAAAATAAARAAEARAREIEAQAKAKEAEEKRKADEAAAAAEAERQKREAAANREREKDQQSLLLTGVAIAAGAIGLMAGLRGGARLATKAAEAAKKTVASINALGKDAAKLNKTKTLVAGTPKGDQMKAIVQEADALGRKTNFATLGKPTAADKVAAGLKVVGAAEVGASYALPAVAPSIGMSQESADRAAMVLRVTGAAALGGGYGMKMATRTAASVRPSSRAISSINAGANRLAREGAGGAAKVSANKVGSEVARSSGKLKAAKSGSSVTASKAQRKAVEAKGTVERSKVRTAKSVSRARRGTGPVQVRSYTRKNGIQVQASTRQRPKRGAYVN